MALQQGVYENLSEREYHADPCDSPSLSASLAKILLSECPFKAKIAHPKLNPSFEESSDTKFDIGKAAHSLILKDPKDFIIVNADDWRTKEAKQYRTDAYAAGKIPLLAHQWESVKQMVEASKGQIASHSDCSLAFQGDKKEVTVIWQEDNGVWCRIRIDSCSMNKVDFYDYKTVNVSANPDTISNYASSLKWDIISSFYKRGIRKVMGIEKPNYYFVAQETESPYLLSCLAYDPMASEIADQKVEYAIKIWGECLSSGKWPAYPSKLAYISTSPYQQSQWMERMERESA